ncbi:MAG TPA: RagB/SusD family nutrient uptake outer membrane protein, partial [Anseongella sp.]|nr:RagB/SusD family nutrient uptake outer membrane protein [Anseongella sp.]
DSLESLQLPRSSVDECVDYIVSELDKAQAELPEWHDNAQDYARIQGAAIQAIKSRVLLYAASPLYNGNSDYANFKNSDGKQLISQQFDAEKWRRAAEAAKAVIEMGRFSLYREMPGGTPDPFLSYQNLFLTPWNEEVIFARADNALALWEQHCTPRFGGGWSGVAVTQQQVDAYRTENGKRINEDGSGYVENGFSAEDKTYTRAGTYNMWVNREPRFYVSVAFNGSEWINHDEGTKQIGLYLTGNTGKQGCYDFSRTGYLVRKNVHPNSNPRIGSYVRRPIILFRLGEFYLNYAEALNEYDPGNPEVLTYVNLIRERAGIPALPGGLSQAEMREQIRTERRVELAFECHRYFDTRRWKIAAETDGGPFYGMNIDAGTSLNDPEFYKRTVFERRVFEQKHYFFPIPQFDIDRNVNLVQNPGW